MRTSSRVVLVDFSTNGADFQTTGSDNGNFVCWVSGAMPNTDVLNVQFYYNIEGLPISSTEPMFDLAFPK